ncbi:MBL fold metallo-hydrolase [Chelativorans sp. M5D2P16]|uniref:MBL fold metallo-hydrolase n=1 Tax=Chelativorans sp. M5D2P16 TaxID=3095678 RepID=UPI002ACAA36F|nr:MBL fold metallo-hydrolase [Chelativorans sp. M5D2P16]MDZ5697073.1 MBL fold metallo-hydrolase [Chelativorans sp. M5D2P16]
MRELYPDLWQTTSEHPMTAFPHSTSNAYLLLQETGNILFYCTGREAIGQSNEQADFDHIADLGGITQVLLGHWHEASPSLKEIKGRFGAEIVVHARDAAPVEKYSGVAPDIIFWDRHMLHAGVEAIPTPGHTVGSACYLYRSPHDRTYLFTGDTIWPARGSWTSATFEDDAKQSAHRSSLDALATLRPDVVLSAISPDNTCAEISPDEWVSATDIAKARLA